MTTIRASFASYVVIYEVDEHEVTEIVTAVKSGPYEAIEIIRDIKAVGR